MVAHPLSTDEGNVNVPSPTDYTTQVGFFKPQSLGTPITKTARTALTNSLITYFTYREKVAREGGKVTRLFIPVLAFHEDVKYHGIEARSPIQSGRSSGIYNGTWGNGSF